MARCLYYEHLRTNVDTGYRIPFMPSRDLIYRELGLLLAQERKRKHYTQAEFASLAGLSRTSVTNIECGRQSIQIHQLYAFAAILRLEVTVLLPKESMLTARAPVETVKHEERARYIENAKKVLATAPRAPGESKRGR